MAHIAQWSHFGGLHYYQKRRNALQHILDEGNIIYYRRKILKVQLAGINRDIKDIICKIVGG